MKESEAGGRVEKIGCVGFYEVLIAYGDMFILVMYRKICPITQPLFIVV